MFDERSFSSTSFSPVSFRGILELLDVVIVVATGAVVAAGYTAGALLDTCVRRLGQVFALTKVPALAVMRAINQIRVMK